MSFIYSRLFLYFFLFFKHVSYYIFSIMLLKENSLSGTIRGQSVASKKFYTSGLRSIAPKFLRDVGDKNFQLRKNANDQNIIIQTKQNIKPEFYSIENSKQGRTLSKLSLSKKLQPLAIQIMPRGLHNIGNTCYMNSTLQCLFHLRSFPTALNQHITNRQTQNIGSVANQLNSVVKEMTSKGSPLNLGALKKAMGKKKPIFLGNAQQDAQEYLTNLLQILNEQLSRITKKCTYKELQGDPSKRSLSQLSNQWWEYYQQIDNSIICDVFQGQTISSIRCRKCDKVSVNFDNIWGIPITFHRNKTVFELLTGGWKSETLVEDFYCSGCKKTRDCTKLIQMFRIPKVLVIQLKRFQYEYGSKKKRKEQTKIQTQIDISKIMNPSANKSQQTRYKLKGVVHHQGQAEYGHYYAEVLCESVNKWYCLNDSIAEQTTFDPVSRSAYLLFYEQF